MQVEMSNDLIYWSYRKQIDSVEFGSSQWVGVEGASAPTLWTPAFGVSWDRGGVEFLTVVFHLAGDLHHTAVEGYELEQKMDGRWWRVSESLHALESPARSLFLLTG